MSSNELFNYSNVYSASSLAGVTGAYEIGGTAGIPAGQFYLGTSEILGLSVSGTTGAITQPVFIQSIQQTANTGVTKITVNSGSNADSGRIVTLYWRNRTGSGLANA